MNNMDEKEIYDELIGQRAWWEKQLQNCLKKADYYKRELEKCNRLIECFHAKS